MAEPVVCYDLNSYGYNLNDIVNESNNNFKILDKYDGNLVIIKYNKEKLNEDNYKTLGRFRSFIYDKSDNRIISYFPQKSVLLSDELNSNRDEKYYFEEFFEGTMINLFWYDLINDWEITTRSNIGGKCSYKPNGETFRSLFLSTLNSQNIEFEDLDKNFCYTFVLQHSKNRIVTPVQKNRVILVDITKCGKDGKVYRFKRNNFYKMIHNIVKTENIILPTRWELPINYVIENLKKAPYHFMGYVLHEPLNDERIKFRNENYEYVRHLKGNNPKTQYRYYHLRKNNLVREYLNFYPEESIEFSKLRNALHKYTKNLYQCYISCYIKKDKPLKEYDYKFKTHMYYLHELYKNELKDSGSYVNMKVVIEYINNLEPPRLMHVVNADFHTMNKEMDKIELEHSISQ